MREAPLRRVQTALKLAPIGVIRTPYHVTAGVPLQPTYARDVRGQVIVDDALEGALDDIEGFERVWLIYWLDRAGAFKPKTTQGGEDEQPHGLFATRATARPMPIGISVVRLLGREGHVLHVADVDMLDATPLLDIKPYVPAFDAFPDSRAGWIDDTNDRAARGR